MSEMNKKDTWRWVINLIVSVLTALAAAIGTSSCIQQVAPTYPTSPAVSPTVIAAPAAGQEKDNNQTVEINLNEPNREQE